MCYDVGAEGAQTCHHETATLGWAGDGFSLGEDQVGRPVNIEGRTGKVVSGDAFFIVVKWDKPLTWWRHISDFVFGRT